MRCEERLNAFRAEGKLKDEAAKYLDGVIAKAKSGSWESAAERLYEFMRAQKGERAERAEGPKGKRR